MAQLILDVRLDEFENPVGYLVRDERGGLAFVYAASYTKYRGAKPISLSLPVRDEPYGDVAARAFFGNLLQERDTALAVVMAREEIARDDIAGLLLHLGRDCPGALSVLGSGSPPAKIPGDYDRDYVALSDDRVRKIVESLYRRQRPPDDTNDPSPLAGVQSKIALTVLPDGRFAEPRPGAGAPTTHILKVPEQGHEQEPRREHLAMTLSREMGVDAAITEVREFGGIEALLIKRFDRDHDAQGRVTRIHQEDFAQALGLPRELKYERAAKEEEAGKLPSERRRFDAETIGRVLIETQNPASARQTLIRSTIFDLLAGNTDAHAKNHALLYRSRRPVPSPRYDILPTRLDRGVSHDLSFKIGKAKKTEDIDREDIDACFRAFGIRGLQGRHRLAKKAGDELIPKFANALQRVDQECGRTWGDLIAANIRQFSAVLGVDIPDDAKDRDAFIPGNVGGWGIS